MNFKNQLIIDEIIDAEIVNENSVKEHSAASNEYWEMIYVNAGNIIVTAGDSVFKAESGVAVFHKPGEMHYVKTTDKKSAEYCTVSFSVCGESAKKLENAVIEFSNRERLLINDLIIQIRDYSADKNKASDKSSENDCADLRFAKTLELLLLLCTKADFSGEKVISEDANIFAEAVNIMKDNILSSLPVSSLADKAGVSLSHLKRIFAAFTDAGVHEYFMELKINYAKEMLRNGMTVTQTAEHTGFNNQNYFSSTFKRITGTSPKAYLSVNKYPKTKERTSPITQKKKKEMPSYLL